MMIHSDVRVTQGVDRHRQLLARADGRSPKAVHPNRLSRWLTSVMSRGQLQPITPTDPKLATLEPSLAAWISSPQHRLGPSC